MKRVITVSSSHGDWEAIYLDGKLKMEGSSLPIDDVVNLYSDNSSRHFSIEVDGEWAENSGGFPNSLTDIPQDVFEEFSSIQVEYDILSGNLPDYFLSAIAPFTIEGDFEACVNTDTGCSMVGDLVRTFCIDLFEDYHEDSCSNTSVESDESILSRHGYSIICESPFELEDCDGNITSGECARFVVSFYKKQ